MNEGPIEMLLQKADSTASEPIFDRPSTAAIRQRIHRRRIIRTTGALAAAAVVTFAFSLLTISMRGHTPPPQPQPERIASLEEQVKQLKTQTDATLKLVQEVLDRDRQQRRLAALEAELASIPDPVRQIEQQVDKAAFVLIYRADRLYKDLNQTESAVAAYKEVIQLFPDNRWANVARERLSQIERRQINKSNDKGETKCEPQNV